VPGAWPGQTPETLPHDRAATVARVATEVAAATASSLTLSGASRSTTPSAASWRTSYSMPSEPQPAPSAARVLPARPVGPVQDARRATWVPSDRRDPGRKQVEPHAVAEHGSARSPGGQLRHAEEPQRIERIPQHAGLIAGRDDDAGWPRCARRKPRGRRRRSGRRSGPEETTPPPRPAPVRQRRGRSAGAPPRSSRAPGPPPATTQASAEEETKAPRRCSTDPVVTVCGYARGQRGGVKGAGWSWVPDA
jgi:hypothetical protein